MNIYNFSHIVWLERNSDKHNKDAVEKEKKAYRKSNVSNRIILFIRKKIP